MSAASFSFAKPLNHVLPVRGMRLSIYWPWANLGTSGTKLFVVMGLSPRYVTLYAPYALKAVKVKRAEWPRLSIVRMDAKRPDEVFQGMLSARSYNEARLLPYNKAHFAQAARVLGKVS